jgi:hypothetical protein
VTKLVRKSLVLAKAEAAYGTDAAPVGTDALLISNLSVDPADLRTADRSFFRPYLGASQQLVLGQSVTISFDIELAGSGTDVTPPGYASLLKACGMGETIDVTKKEVRYKPVSGDYGSVTIHFYADGTKQVISGARGNMSLSLSPGEIPRMSFTFTGLYNKATETANPTEDTTKFKEPLPITKGTSTLSLDGLAAVTHEFSLDLGNQVTHQQAIGSDAVLITDRQASGSVVIDMPASNTKDFVDKAKNAETVALEFSLGSVAGSKVAIATPKVQLADPGMGDVDGVRTLTLGLRLLPSSGNDELTITTS